MLSAFLRPQLDR